MTTLRLFLILIFVINLKVFAQEFLVKEEFDKVLKTYVDSAQSLFSEDEIKVNIKKGPYETTREFEKRYERVKTKLQKENEKKRSKKLGSFYKSNAKTISVMIPVDSVQYDADTEMAKLFFERITIPNNLGKPKINAYVYPVFTYPDAWSAKKGFGLKMREIRIIRNFARENDIIRRKGKIRLKFEIGNDGNIPSIRLLSAKWTNNDIFYWTWKGRASIPVSDLRGVIKGQL